MAYDHKTFAQAMVDHFNNKKLRGQAVKLYGKILKECTKTSSVGVNVSARSKGKQNAHQIKESEIKEDDEDEWLIQRQKFILSMAADNTEFQDEEKKETDHINTVIQMQKDNEMTPIYNQLIEMGFDHDRALKASKISSTNIIEALAIVQKMGDDQEDEKKKDISHDMENTKLQNSAYRHIVDTKGSIKDQNDKLSPIYKQLIEMGYEHDTASRASLSAPSNIIDAINKAIQIRDNLQKEEEEKVPMEMATGVEEQFVNFLKRSKMEKYYQKFEENDCNDLDSIPLFDDDFLRDDIGVKNKILRKKFLIKCNTMNKEMKHFKDECGINEFLYKTLAEHGIVSLFILCDSIENKQDLQVKYLINNDIQRDLLWTLKEKYEFQGANAEFEGS